MSSPVAEGSRRETAYAWLLGLLAALGSVVFIEPAPYDLFAIVLFSFLAVTSLSFPREIGLPFACLMVFLIGNILASALAAEPLETIRSLSVRVYMVLTWVLLLSLIVVRPRFMLDALWLGYLVAAIIAAVWGLLEYFGLIAGERWLPGVRAHAGFKDPNVYGPFIVPAGLLMIRRLSEGGRGWIIHVPLLCLFSLAVMLSFSRGAWINYLISGGLFVLLLFFSERSARVRMKWIIAATLVAASVAALLVAILSVDIVRDRFAQRAVLSQAYDLKSGGRFDTQRQTLAHVASDPVGVGPGRSDEVFGLEPHNLYLHVFVESGWLGGGGLLLFLGITGLRLLSLLSRHTEYRKDAFLVAACLTGLLIQSLFIDSTHWRHLWLLLAVAWALIIDAERLRRTKNYNPQHHSFLPRLHSGSRII